MVELEHGLKGLKRSRTFLFLLKNLVLEKTDAAIESCSLQEHRHSYSVNIVILETKQLSQQADWFVGWRSFKIVENRSTMGTTPLWCVV